MVEAAHVVRRIAGPALAADVVVEAAVAVGDDVEAGELLVADEAGQRVLVLLAEAPRHHRLEEMPGAEIFGVPARPRQRAGDRRRQNDVLGGAIHGSPPRDFLLRSIGERAGIERATSAMGDAQSQPRVPVTKRARDGRARSWVPGLHASPRGAALRLGREAAACRPSPDRTILPHGRHHHRDRHSRGAVGARARGRALAGDLAQRLPVHRGVRDCGRSWRGPACFRRSCFPRWSRSRRPSSI